MNLQVESLDTHEARLTISVDDATVDKARRNVARNLSKQYRIPGFRPGHAPINTVVSVVGADFFASELANEIANDVYPKALDESGVEPYGPGAIEDVKQAPFQLVVKIPLEPVVDLKDYKSIRLPFPEVSVTDEEVQTQVDNIREENAIVEKVDRPAEIGDLVEAHVVGKIGDEEVFHSHNRRGLVIDPTKIGIPGLAELIVGMKEGETKNAQLTFPEDYGNEQVNGKTADVEIEVQRVSSRTLPEADDALAQTIGQFDTLDALRADLRKQILDYKSSQANRQYVNQSLDAFAALAEVKMPPAFVENNLNELIDDLKDDVKEQEGLPFDEWLKLQGKTDEQIREEYRETAKQRGLRGLVMRELARAEQLNVSDNEIASEVEFTALRYGGRQKEVRKLLQQSDTRSTVANNILSSKILNRMATIAKGEGDAPAAEATIEAAPVEPAASNEGEAAPTSN